MSELDSGAAPSSELPKDLPNSSKSNVSTKFGQQTALDIGWPDQGSALHSTKPNLLSQNTKPSKTRLNVQSRVLLELFDEAVSAVIAVDARSPNSPLHTVGQELDNLFLRLRFLIDNIANAVPGQYSPGEGLMLLDGLGGSAASSLKLLLNDLKENVGHLLALCSDKPQTLAEKSGSIRDSISVLVGRLDDLQEVLKRDIRAVGTNDCNIFDEEDSTNTISVLALDGGGVRGLSSLFILKALMDSTRSIMMKHDRADNATESIRPCDVFNYVYGSGSGGLLAIMLSRLKMTEDDCRNTFLTHTKSIFSRPRLRHNIAARPKYSQKRLIEGVKRIIRDFDPDLENEKWKRNMFAAPRQRCRCGVTAWAPELGNANLPRMFRTYDIRSGLDIVEKASDCKIWQAALATSATPGYFPVIEINNWKYLDAGFGTYNPSHESFLELSKIHHRNPLCFVSIGCGKRAFSSKLSRQSSFRSSFNYIQAAKELVTDSATVHRNMLFLAEKTEKLTYFRFDTPGLDSVALDEWAEARKGSSPNARKLNTVDFIKEQTDIYLSQPGTKALIHECARALVDSYFMSRDPSMSLVAKLCASAKDQGLKRDFFVPARNNTFSGREDVLAQLKECLTQTIGRQGSKLRLIGQGGVGKSQIAIEYSHRCKNDFDLVYWAPASSQKELRQSYSSIIERHLRSGSDGVSAQIENNEIEILRSWLSNTDKRWLLILDNVDELQDVASYLPSSTEGSIIMTTRRKSIDLPGSHTIFVDAIDALPNTAKTVTQAWQKLNLLSFDSGGKRGYWSLLVLKRLMQHIARIEQNDVGTGLLGETASHSFHPEQYPTDLATETDAFRKLKFEQRYLPCHYFDLIGGSSTGSLIAIMLGRFRMTVFDCILEYENLTLKMFGKPRLFSKFTLSFGIEKYDTDKMEKAIQQCARRRCDMVDFRKDSILFPSRSKMCKSFVTALVLESKDGSDRRPYPMYLIRSYDHKKELLNENHFSNFSSVTSMDSEGIQHTTGKSEHPFRNINYGPAEHMEVWQVARAATAAPQYFRPFYNPNSSSKESFDLFLDGGLASKNPTWEGVQEIWDLNGRESLNVVLSVGDAQIYQTFSRNLKKSLKLISEIGSDAERVHEQVQRESKYKGNAFAYFRLDATWSSNVPMNEYNPGDTGTSGSKTFEKMRKSFEEWADTVEERFQRCAFLLVQQRRLRTLDRGQWETYSTGSIYRCSVSPCTDECTNRFEFREHMEQSHGVNLNVDDEQIKAQRKIWQYQSG